MTDLDRNGKIGLVPARFGPAMVGGAEIVLAEMAAGLIERGWDVEILTTCALDHFTWSNEYEAGVYEQDGMVVRRFPVTNTANPERAELEAAILRGDRLPISLQERWINGGMRVPELYHHLVDHASDYRALVFAPYPFWVTFAGAQVAPERSLLLTCLHDEPYAYQEIFQPMFSGVAGLLMMTEPEHELAHRVCRNLARHEVVGCGVDVPTGYDPGRFRDKYSIDGPFLLYAGRREGAKGWEQLLESLATVFDRTSLPFSLVTIGRGEVNPPERIADRVIDLGFLSDVDRNDAFSAASAAIQPSQWEAFSRTVMEAWLAGTPVIANNASDVVAWHCQRSGAGLTYDDDYELEQCLLFLAERPEEAASMASAGRGYVLDNYQWPRVLDGVEAALNAWTRP